MKGPEARWKCRLQFKHKEAFQTGRHGLEADTEPFCGLALCDRTAPSRRGCPAVNSSPASQGLGMSPVREARMLGLQACLSLAGEAGLTLTLSPPGNGVEQRASGPPASPLHAELGLSCHLSLPRC